WKTIGAGAAAHESISPSARKPSAGGEASLRRVSFPRFAQIRFTEEKNSFVEPADLVPTVDAAKPVAPIRVTSPGLTVYKGGAVTPRLYVIQQHLGDLDVDRQMVDVSISYTPSPRVQLEVEVPFSRTAYDDGTTSGSE